jgi:hypothetical protein
MNEITPETFDPSCWYFRKLKDFEYPGGVSVYEYGNHPVVNGAPDFLRLNLYLSKDGDYVTIWFGLVDPSFAESRLGPVQTPANFSFEEYDEVLFRGYIASPVEGKCILNALRLNASSRYAAPQVLSGGTENKLRCDPVEAAE